MPSSLTTRMRISLPPIALDYLGPVPLAPVLLPLLPLLVPPPWPALSPVLDFPPAAPPALDDVPPPWLLPGVVGAPLLVRSLIVRSVRAPSYLALASLRH